MREPKSLIRTPPTVRNRLQPYDGRQRPVWAGEAWPNRAGIGGSGPGATNPSLPEGPSFASAKLGPMSKATFSPTLFTDSLPEEHLEILSEFSEQAEAQLRLLARSIKHHKEPTARDLLNVLAEAPAALARRRRTSYDQEWNRELSNEVLASEKSGSRLAAVLTVPEIHAMLEHTKDDPRDHLIIRLLYASGMRRSELTGLLVADFDPHAATLFVRAGKGDKDRYVLIDDETVRLIIDYIQALNYHNQIFDISDRTVDRAVKAAGKALGIAQRYAAMGRRFSAHSLRHTCATHLYEGGCDIYEVRELLGHSSISTTRTYVHMAVGRMRENYRKAHPLSQGV